MHKCTTSRNFGDTSILVSLSTPNLGGDLFPAPEIDAHDCCRPMLGTTTVPAENLESP